MSDTTNLLNSNNKNEPLIASLNERFKQIFNLEAKRNFFSPGRINLIGEHIDYSGGNVFPSAITFGTYAVVRERNDRIVRLYSENFEAKGIIQVNLDTLVFDEKDDWANYPKGVLKMLLDAGYKLDNGFDALFFGNIPNGAGLSSSASLEVLTGLIATTINDVTIDMLDIVKLSQKAENEFVGVQCGIMDQFAVGMAKKDSAMLLNTNTLEYSYVPVNLEDNIIVIMNTNKRRGLADSAYNERRTQCETALKILQSVEHKEYLCDYSLEFLEENKSLLSDPLVYKRAHHAITENERSLKASKVLLENDLESFGLLMNQSHVSLRDDYDVTGIELDTIVEAAWDHPATIGARVTGAGFGGCAIAIVNQDSVDDFIESVQSKYSKTIGYKADFYVASIGQGAHEII